MRRNLFTPAVVWFVLALFLALPGTLQAQDIELKEGMTQGDFALWLVKALGAQNHFLQAGETNPKAAVNLLVNPAAGPEEAIKFLTELGSVPEGDWKKNEPITTEWLAGLLEKPEEATNLSFDDLVAKVLEEVRGKFQAIDKKQAVFRVLGATPSQPAGL